MIQMLKTWILSLVAAAILLSLLYTLLPKRIFRGVGKVTGGLILLLVFLQPLVGMQWEDLSEKYRSYEQMIDQQIEIYTQTNQQQMMDIIEQELNAYIWETAAQMGVECQAAVETQMRDGVPYPVTVTLSAVYNEELSAHISRELGISPEQQYWEGSK